jgi:sterol desaturase/sphingolipid hydroxylase (fatty acid hydroxylase superfamily)
LRGGIGIAFWSGMSTTSTASRRTLIEERRWLLNWFGANSLAPVLLFAAALGSAMAWLGSRGVARTLAVALWGAAGVVYWTFCEYALHRWLYHWTPRQASLRRVVESFHVYHHRNPDDRAVWNAGPALVVLLTAVLALPPLALLGATGSALPRAAWVMFGAVAAYALYEVVHYECHARVHTRGPMRYLQAFHLRHHQRNWRRNFGVTNPFWDWLFGTLARGER